MQTPLTAASRSSITAQIATLDLLISKLTKIFNSTNFKTGSVMVSGKNSLGKDYHELLVWDNTTTALPKSRLKAFVNDWSQDLIAQRATLLSLLDGGQVSFQDATREHPCNYCGRVTIQRNYEILPGPDSIMIPAGNSWICNECETKI